jgi:hypothetical protein
LKHGKRKWWNRGEETNCNRYDSKYLDDKKAEWVRFTGRAATSIVGETRTTKGVVTERLPGLMAAATKVNEAKASNTVLAGWSFLMDVLRKVSLKTIFSNSHSPTLLN